MPDKQGLSLRQRRAGERAPDERPYGVRAPSRDQVVLSVMVTLRN